MKLSVFIGLRHLTPACPMRFRLLVIRSRNNVLRMHRVTKEINMELWKRTGRPDSPVNSMPRECVSQNQYDR